MATLNSSNITTGNTVEANDLLQLYDALTPGGGTTGAYSVSISGSITGSASTATSASFATTASYALNGGSGGSGFPFSGSAVITGSLTVSGSGLTVRGTTTLSGSTNMSGSIIISGSTNISGSINLVGSTATTNWVASKEAKLNWSSAGAAGTGYLAIPLAESNSPIAGAMYVNVQSDPRTLYIYDGSAWRSVELT